MKLNMSFLIKDDELPEKCNKIWDKVTNIILQHIILIYFSSEPVYNEKFLKTKIKSDKGKINTNFHDDKISKECSRCIFLSVILIYSIFKMGKNYYLQVFLEECKYIAMEKKEN